MEDVDKFSLRKSSLSTRYDLLVHETLFLIARFSETSIMLNLSQIDRLKRLRDSVANQLEEAIWGTKLSLIFMTDQFSSQRSANMTKSSQLRSLKNDPRKRVMSLDIN